jgi:hypothetical protein
LVNVKALSNVDPITFRDNVEDEELGLADGERGELRAVNDLARHELHHVLS